MSERKAAFKVAVRNAQRNKRRTFLLVALVAAPVFVAVVVAGFMRASHISQEERALADFGNASVIVTTSGRLGGDFGGWVRSTVKEISPAATVVVHRGIWRGWTNNDFSRLTDADLSDPTTAGMLRLTEGRAPTARDEVAVSEYFAQTNAVSVGDTLATALGPGAEMSFRIVGLTSHPLLWRNSQAVVTPEALEDLRSQSVSGSLEERILITAPEDAALAQTLRERWQTDMHLFHPDGAAPLPAGMWLSEYEYFALDAEQVDEAIAVWESEGEEAAWELISGWLFTEGMMTVPTFSINIESRSERLMWNSDNPLQTAPAIGSAVAAVLLVEVAFIAGAAFATGIRRRLREIGLMGANGADDGQVKATILGEGLVVGVAGGLAGASLAALALMAGRSTMQRFVERRIDEFPLAAVDLVGPVLLAVVACALAAWIPSRSAATVPTLTALQGRMPASEPKRWVPIVGVVLSALGTLILAAGLGSQAHAATVIGVVLMIGGVAMLAGPLVAWIARLANRLPISARVVLRDSGRNRTRAAAAVAATMVIVVLPVIGMAGGNSSVASERIFGLSSLRPEYIVTGTYDPETSIVTPFGPENREDLRWVMSEIARVFPDAQTADLLVSEMPVTYPAAWAAVQSGVRLEDTGTIDPARTAVANADLLRLLDDERLERALASEGMVLIGVAERRTAIGLDGVNTEVAEVPVPVPLYGFPRLLVTEEKALELGVTPTLAYGYATVDTIAFNLFTSYWDPLSDLGLNIQGSSSFGEGSAMPMVLGAMVLATLLVVLIVVAVVTSLSATEADGDLRTMVAVGAQNSIRRKYLGLQSWMHTSLGTLLAIPLGLLLVSTAVKAGYTYRTVGSFGTYDSSLLYVPWPAVIGLAIGLPLVVGLLTALFVRSAPTTPPRRAF